MGKKIRDPSGAKIPSADTLFMGNMVRVIYLYVLLKEKLVLHK